MSEAGRPALYNTPKELQLKAVEYFAQYTGEENEEAVRLYGKKPTITGLVLHLGFCDRASFYDYEKREEFSHTIKYLRTMIENVYESRLCGANVSGVIFALKNLGWTDKTQIEAEINAKVVEMPSISKKLPTGESRLLEFHIGEQ